jgi:predicted NAD-dependent protein-ADP-ribosyltransferase YbiA (DUF1768 family)
MTAGHCLQAQKFLPRYPDVAQHISLQPTEQDLVNAVRAYHMDVRPDWDQVRVRIMDKILRAKLDFNPEVELLLLETGKRELVYDGLVRTK